MSRNFQVFQILQVAVGGIAAGAGNTIAYNGASRSAGRGLHRHHPAQFHFQQRTEYPGSQEGLGIDLRLADQVSRLTMPVMPIPVRTVSKISRF